MSKGARPLELAALEGLIGAGPTDAAEDVDALLALDAALDRLAALSDRLAVTASIANAFARIGASEGWYVTGARWSIVAAERE